MCLAEGHNAVAPVRLEPRDKRFRVKHSTTTVNLNPENKLYEMKKLQLLFFRNNVFIFNFSKMCER